MENTSTFAPLMKGVATKFADVFVQNAEQYKSPLIDFGVFKKFSEAEARKTFYNRTGTGFMQSSSEGADVNKVNRIPAYQTEAIPTPYNQGVVVTHERIMYNDYSQELSEYADIVRAGNSTIDLSLSMPFIKAFDTDQPTLNGIKITRYGDGVPFSSTVHPTRVPGKSSQSNASATGLDLTYTNFDTARQALVNQLTDDGVPLTVAPNFILMVGPARRTKALEIAGGALKIDTADNNINVFKGEVVDVIENLYFSTTYGAPSDNMWAVIDRNRAKMFFWQAEPLTPSKYEFENRSMSFSVFGAHSVGHFDWRGIWMSKGDGAAYAS